MSQMEAPGEMSCCFKFLEALYSKVPLRNFALGNFT